jgi:hypothetical protein
VKIAQELFDAIPLGPKTVWEKYVAEDVIYTDENWRNLTKRQLIESLSLFPKGYSGSIENTFFPKGTVRGEKIFVRDASGRVTSMLDRRENNDLVWKRK